MVVQIGIPARPDVDHNTQTRNAWVCDKCGFEEPLKSITAKRMYQNLGGVLSR
jgi:hypothetical protein